MAAAAALGAACGLRLTTRQPGTPDAGPDPSRWTMPPIGTLPPPSPSPARTLGLVVLRCYLLLATAAVIVKVVRLMIGS